LSISVRTTTPEIQMPAIRCGLRLIALAMVATVAEARPIR
jgi:hypothetical protein